MFLVEAAPGRGAPLHFHEYDEIVLLQEGQSRFVIGDVIREAGPGDNRPFKRQFGVPPARYRREHRASWNEPTETPVPTK